MDDRRRTAQEQAADKNEDEAPEKVLPGEVVPENEWDERQRYLREVVNPDNT